MKENKLSKYIPFGMFGIQAIYFVVLFIAVLIKAYRFSDLSFTLIYLFAIILMMSISSFKYMAKLKVKTIELSDKLWLFILFLLPSTFTFVFFFYFVMNVEYYFD